MDIEYRIAKKVDVKKIAKLFDKAFYGYIFHDLLSQGVKKKDKFIYSFLFTNIMVYVKRQRCFIGVSSGKIVSAVLLRAYSEPKPRLIDYVFSGGIKLLFMAGIAKLKNLFSVLDQAELECRNYNNASQKNVWFLEQIAVDLSLQSQHLGSKIINDFVVPFIATNGGEVLTLITNSEKNCRFYTNNGFEEFAHSVIERNNLQVNNWSFKRTIHQ